MGYQEVLVLTEDNQLIETTCITASSVNMFKNKVDTYFRRADYNVGLSISQWPPCPLAFWTVALAILLNLVT